MAYAELDRQYIRRFAGFSATFAQADPRLENAITATQAVADGGSRPDANTENAIKAYIYGAAAVTGTASGVTPGPGSQNLTFATPAIRGMLQIEASIAAMDQFLGATEATGQAKIDAAREVARLKAEGQRMAYNMCRMLGMRRPRVKVFYGGGDMVADANPYPFAADTSPIWG